MAGGPTIGCGSGLGFKNRNQKIVWVMFKEGLRIPSYSSILAMEMSWQILASRLRYFPLVIGPNLPFFFLSQMSMVGPLRAKALTGVTVRFHEPPGIELPAVLWFP